MNKSGRIRNSVPESEGKKDTSVAKKQVAKKPKLAEKDSGYESASSSSAASTDQSKWLKQCLNDRRVTSNNFRRRSNFQFAMKNRS